VVTVLRMTTAARAWRGRRGEGSDGGIAVRDVIEVGVDQRLRARNLPSWIRQTAWVAVRLTRFLDMSRAPF
jgi:hypothetical protein